MIYPLMTFSITNTFDNTKSTRLDGEREPLHFNETLTFTFFWYFTHPTHPQLLSKKEASNKTTQRVKVT